MDSIATMRAFAAVVAAGSFTGGAARMGISTALASKYVSRLEDRLGARLINRTTRSLNVTEVGRAYHQRCLQLLDDLDELEAAVGDEAGPPKGELRISAPRTFGEMHLTCAVGDFLAENPQITVAITLSERFVDIVDEGYDMAVRIGVLPDSSLFARRIAATPLVTCAAPAYLDAHGRPETPAHLADFDCIIDTNLRRPEQWVFGTGDAARTIQVGGRFRVNSAAAARNAVVAGVGIALVPLFAIADDLRDGRAEVLLAEHAPSALGVYIVYPHNRHLTGKVRAFVDFLAKRFSGDPTWQTVTP